MKKVEKNWLEWVVFALSLLLVTSTVGYLIYAGVSMGHQPPSIEVRLGTPEQRQFNFIVPVTVVNHGDETAEGVKIEVVLESSGEEKARGEVEIPFLPRHSTREAWVAFEQDPRAAQLKARVLGYQNLETPYTNVSCGSKPTARSHLSPHLAQGLQTSSLRYVSRDYLTL